MKILNKPEQAFVPDNQPQPDQFLPFYLIPETRYIPRQQRASNDPLYNQSQPTRINTPREPAFRKYARIKMEFVHRACAATSAAIKAFGRATVRWLARWVVLPLSIACTFWIDVAGPADLPL